MKHNIQPVPSNEELAYCVVCDAAEGEIPTECPGSKMTPDQKDKVLYGELNFKDGVWFKPRKYFKYGGDK